MNGNGFTTSTYNIDGYMMSSTTASGVTYWPSRTVTSAPIIQGHDFLCPCGMWIAESSREHLIDRAVDHLSHCIQHPPKGTQ